MFNVYVNGIKWTIRKVRKNGHVSLYKNNEFCDMWKTEVKQ